MIRQMEVSLGKPHTESPFPSLFQKYGFSTKVEQPAPVESKEESKEEAPPKVTEKPKKEQKQKQPP